ncbi:MAG: phospholipase D family protein [Zoogloeaceae bacterium]|nr:phospholipase D family protein [Zoogloeaceae bacterium]
MKLLRHLGCLCWLCGALAAFSLPGYAAPTTRLEAAFSPGEAGEALVLKAIGNARHTLWMAAYAFTSKPVAQALLTAKKRGVEVLVVADASQLKDPYSVIGWLAARGIAVRIDHKHAIQHNKYLVIDNATIQTGSYNYTSSAKLRNGENVLVIWHAPPDIVSGYARDFRKHWGHAQKYRRR